MRRYYKDKHDRGYGGNRRVMAGFPFGFAVLFNAVRNHWVKGPGPKRASFVVLFYVFSGRIQSSRYVKRCVCLCAQDATRRRAD